MSQYAVLIEKGEQSFGAYVPDLPGCVAVGETREEAERLIRGAITLHLNELRRAGEPIPRPTTAATSVEIPPA